MSLTIAVLNNDEQIIRYLDPELIQITEINEQYHLRAVNIEYYVEGINDYKSLFRMGNKIWISSKELLFDCIYVINNEIENDLFEKNNVSFEPEEKLVELNYAFFSQTNCWNKEVGEQNDFHMDNHDAIIIDYNALRNWFGLHFEIGIIQDCLSEYLQKVKPTGTMSLMELLRFIEEETGNVFIAQYEKDAQTNKIHSYLNFLNPKSNKKDWELHLFYRFPRDSRDEINAPEVSENEDILESEDNVYFPDYVEETPLNPSDLKLRLKYNEDILFEDDAIELGFTGEDDLYEFILNYSGTTLDLKINSNTNPPIENIIILNGTMFELYNTVTNRVVYSHNLNPKLGDIHTEILDLGFNVENINYNLDESDTFIAIAPVISSDGADSLNDKQFNALIENWEKLSVTKGQLIPMIVQKRTVTGTEENPCTGWDTGNRSAKSILGTCNLSNNYWSRPIKPNDSEDSENKSYEVWVGTAYWRAPFNKIKDELYVVDDEVTEVEYTHVRGNEDNIDESATPLIPKCGQVETSDEDSYAIFNDVCMKLKDKRTPEINVEVDVANLLKGKFNDYNIFDTVYIKIPGFEKIITATVSKTEKNPLNIGENKVELTNYSLNKKVAPIKTHIEAFNMGFMYPNSATLTVTLQNIEVDPLEGIPDKLLTFTVYSYENESKNLTDKIHVKETDENGQASINLNLDPGTYIIDIQFGSDVEYAATSTSINVSVGGTKEVIQKATPKKTTTIKDTKKVRRYFSKYGVSPNKDHDKLCAIGRKSTGDKKKDSKYYVTIFKRKCPHCGSKELYWYIFWAGGEHKTTGTFPPTGKKEKGSDRGRVFCKKCGHGWNALGESIGKGKNLKEIKKTRASKKAKAYELRDGSRQYDTVTRQYKLEKNLGNQGERIPRDVHNTGITYSSIPTKKVIDTAKNVVGNSTGIPAAKKIAKWIAKNIKSERRAGFYQSPATTLSRERGNCCCHADLFAQMCDATGVTSKYDVYYVHVGSEKYGKRHFFNRINGVDVDCQARKKKPWGHASYRGRSVRKRTKYPELPLSRKY